ncbi:GSU2204 family CXXCH-containing (seleno)protein [Desulfuromonas acetoxidans]|uniref:GSU2204 family CXXCH-containing (seleno)protein n=1 Tax=Desulfuromonas acetoxidans TaxID=891 RepID=UPI002930A92A|nr:GSU2204 family CXXCH-containing (seleno)protein [Desulfuromonas acetoxidans]
MKQLRTYVLLASIAVLMMATSGFAADWSEASINLGYTGVSSDDSLNKTAEYESMDSSIGGGLELDVRQNGVGIELEGQYTDEEESEGSARFDIKRVLRAKYNYQKFIHRLRHDLLFEDKPHLSATAGTPGYGSFEPSINAGGEHDIYDGIIAANAVPLLTEAGTVGLEGLQTATFNDLDQGRDYMIERRKHEASAKLQLPAFPYLVPEVKFSHEEKHGWQQTTLMTGQCTPCHTVAVGQEIDQTTEEVSIGATFKMAGLTASYFHTEREFDNRSDDYAHEGRVDNDYYYDDIAKPYYDRLLFENESQEIGITADIEKKMDTVKLRYDAAGATTLYGSYVSADTKNNYNDLEYDSDTLFFSASNRSIAGLRLKAYAKQYEIDSDDLYVDMTSYTADTEIVFGADTIPVSDFNYNRPSSASRDVFETGLDASYVLGAGTMLTGAYTYKVVDRDNGNYKEYDSSLRDEAYLDDEETTYNTFELGISSRPMSSVNLRAKYTYEHADTPFSFSNGLGYNDLNQYGWTQLMDSDPDPLDMTTNSPFYEVLRSWNRTTSGSNVAENHHQFKASGTWTPNDIFSLSVNGQYTFEENDEAYNDWENNSWNAGVSIFMMPTEKLTFSAGYDYQYGKTTSKYATALYVGCFSESMGEQIASVYDNVDYDTTAQVLYLSTTYQATNKLTLSGDLTLTKAEASADNPNFGDNIYYENYVDYVLSGMSEEDYLAYLDANDLPYTQTIMMSYLDYSGSDDYSDLDYETLDLTLGAEYRFNSALTLAVSGFYRWVEDGEAYLGDDYDGELYLVNTSVSYRF